MTNAAFSDEPEIQPLEAEELEDLISEAPRLGLIRPFIESVRRTAWFADLGTAPRPTVRNHARDYLDGLGFPDAALAPITTWDDAADAAACLDWESPAWEAEEQIRAALTVDATEALGEDILEIAMTHVAAEASAPVRAAIGQAAALWDMRDEAVANAAAGTAIQACHLAALTLLTGQADDGHPFAAKFALFEAGRWPIGIVGLSFNLF